MSEKFLCVLASYNAATETYFSGIQQQLYDHGFVGRHTRNLPQHITLGTFPVEMEGELVQRVQQAADDTAVFGITFNHVGVFQGGQVLFLAPDANDPLLRLKERFGAIPDWTAHTTMLIDDTDKILQAIPIVLDAFATYAGQVTALHLYEFFPTRHILSLPLQNNSAI